MNYYKQGDAANADRIKAAFEKLGFDVGTNSCAQKGLYFTFDGKVCYTNDYVYPRDMMLETFIKKDPDYKELELPVEPKFRVGDKIEATIYGIKRRVTIREVDKTNLCYFGTLEECIGFSEQDQWHLAPKPHYDIANFKVGMPVLVRVDESDDWRYVQFSHVRAMPSYRFIAGAGAWNQCIPFNEDTKHLLGTTDMCDEQYINW